jgi:leader peptidase (prepilin peptidase)/N-methyltransferase
LQPASEPPVADAALEEHPWRVPAAVALASALSVTTIFLEGVHASTVVDVFAICTLVALAAIDIDRRVLPNRIVLPATAVVLVAQLAIHPGKAAEWILSALGAAIFLALPLLFNPNGMGLGDVKLGLFLGAWLGSNVIVALLLAFLAVLPVSLYKLVRHGKAARKMTIAFGPFLAFGAIVTGIVAGA